MMTRAYKKRDTYRWGRGTLKVPPRGACATILPAPAVDMLRQAVMVDPETAPGFSQDRSIALNTATTRVKLLYPQFFIH